MIDVLLDVLVWDPGRCLIIMVWNLILLFSVNHGCCISTVLNISIDSFDVDFTCFFSDCRDDKPKYFDVKLSHELYQLAEDMYLHLQLPQLILQSLESLDSSSMKRQLISNIILTGGNCRLSGLAHRLSHDLQRLLPGDLSTSVRVVDPRLMTGRSDAVIGASYIKKWHHALWISRKDFIVLGEKAVNRDGRSLDASPTACGFNRTTSSRSNLSIVDCYSCGLSDYHSS